MFIGFEGTGMSASAGEFGLNDLSYSTSLIWKAYEQANTTFKVYLAGPNIQGTNCKHILRSAIDFYEVKGQFDPDTRIVLFGYSRGAYIAMCFAKYLQQKGKNVSYLGMFDAVSKDFKDSIPEKYRTTLVPSNVQYCFHAARSRLVGSRNFSMDYAGQKYETNNKTVIYKICPGSHAAMGGFPNEAGYGDSPNRGFSNPKNGRKFDSKREITGWYHSAKHVSVKAAALGLLKSSLTPLGPYDLIPETKWDWDNLKMYGYDYSIHSRK